MADAKFKMESKGKILSFGELLLRICPDVEGEWLQHQQLPFYVGGAEANVAVALALWQMPVAYCTVVPENLMVKQIAAMLEKKGVDTSTIIYAGDKLGLYFLPKGKDLKNAGVIYDRSNSSFAGIKAGTIDWDKIFDGIGWFNFSAIAPAISANTAAICKEALQAARQKGITISVDLNYRAKLWQYGVAPIDIMPDLLQYCHVVMGNIWAAEKMLGIAFKNLLLPDAGKADYLLQAKDTGHKMQAMFPNVQIVANTFRFTNDEGLSYFTTLQSGNTMYESTTYNTSTIIDQVGSGDCFMAGIIYGLYHSKTYQETIDFATAAAFSKLFTEGDFTNKTINDIEQFKLAYAHK